MNEYDQELQQLEGDEFGEEQSSGFIRRFRLPIIAAIVVVAILITWVFLNRDSDETTIELESVTTTNEHEPPPFGEVYLINEIIINPAGGRRHFMVSIGIEHFSPDKVNEIQRREPLLRDNLITFFSSQPPEVLTNIKYRQAIRSRVKKIIDYQLGEGFATRIFFEKWVFQ